MIYNFVTRALSGKYYPVTDLISVFHRTAFKMHDKETSDVEDDAREGPAVSQKKCMPRSLSPIKHQGHSTVSQPSAPVEAPATVISPQQSTQTPPTTSPSTGKREKRKKPAFLTQAFFNTVAPGLASFARTTSSASRLDVVIEEDEEEEDPDVIAIMADF